MSGKRSKIWSTPYMLSLSLQISRKCYTFLPPPINNWPDSVTVHNTTIYKFVKKNHQTFSSVLYLTCLSLTWLVLNVSTLHTLVLLPTRTSSQGQQIGFCGMKILCHSAVNSHHISAKLKIQYVGILTI